MKTVRRLVAVAAIAAGLFGGRSAWAQPPAGSTRLSYVDDTAESRRSIGGNGFAVRFIRPESAKSLVAVQIFASRYGLPQVPAEHFHVYVLDVKGKLLRDVPCPYALIERAEMRWYTIPLPNVEVPAAFSVGLNFNAEQTKGVYLGMDRSVTQSHSAIGLPDNGYQPVSEKYDWMVRAYVSAGKGKASKTRTRR